MMSPESEAQDTDFLDLVQQIKDSDASDVDKLAWAFQHITGSIVEHAGREVELARALHDQEAVVKHQIKMETIKAARSIFQDCYRLVLGRRAWDE
jgi:hypothetical protein